MVFVKAGPAEILRSSQKDEFVINKLRSLCEDTFLRLAGPRLLIKYKSLIDSLCQLLYYGNTTVCGLQTLGEEYTGILQVDGSFQSIPSIINRIIMVVLQCFGERLTEKLLSELQNNVHNSEEMRPQAKKNLLRWISITKAFIPSISLLHKAMFYCNWDTYHISKRLTNVHYVLIRYWLRDRKSLFGFRVLGGITLANLMLYTFQTLHESLSKDKFGSVEETEQFKRYGCVTDKKCVMCLNMLKDPTATMCGHVFCWDCINDWSQSQENCPICREAISQQRLIPLMNYL